MPWKRAIRIAGLVLLAPSAFADEIQAPGETITLGRGYDRFTGEVRGNCLHTDPMEVPVTAGGSTLVSQYQLLQRESSLLHSGYFSVSAKYKGFGGYFSAVSDIQINNFSSYVTAKADVEVIVKSISERPMVPRLSETAKALYHSNPQEFRVQCGDTFASTIAYGGRFLAIVEVLSSSQTEKTDFEGKLGIAFINADVEGRDRFVQSSSSKSIKIHQVVGAISQSVTTTTDLSKFLARYPASIANMSPQQLRPVRVGLLEYNTLEPAQPGDHLAAAPFFNDNAKATFVEQADAFLSLLRRDLSNAKYAKDHPEQFQPFDIATADSSIQAGELIRLDIQRRISDCLDTTQRTCGTFIAPAVTVSKPVQLPGPSRDELRARIQQAQSVRSQFFVLDQRMADFCWQDIGIGSATGPHGLNLRCINAINNILVPKCEAAGCFPRAQ